MTCLVNQNCGSCRSAKETEERMWCWDTGFLFCLLGAFIQSDGGVRQVEEEFVLRPLKRDPTALPGEGHNENC